MKLWRVLLFRSFSRIASLPCLSMTCIVREPSARTSGGESPASERSTARVMGLPESVAVTPGAISTVTRLALSTTSTTNVPARRGDATDGSGMSLVGSEPKELAPGLSQNRPARVSQPSSARNRSARAVRHASISLRYAESSVAVAAAAIKNPRSARFTPDRIPSGVPSRRRSRRCRR